MDTRVTCVFLNVYIVHIAYVILIRLNDEKQVFSSLN